MRTPNEVIESASYTAKGLNVHSTEKEIAYKAAEASCLLAAATAHQAIALKEIAEAIRYGVDKANLSA